jgi:hypothetical protein
MVVKGFLNVLSGVLVWLLGLLPHLAVPSWLSSLGGSLATISSGLSGTTGWVPWGELFIAVALALSAIGISVAVRGFRIVASFLTLGGGA